jgi:hypothetical protein
LTFFDRQFFPLAAQVKQSQNVVEDHQQGQFRRGAPAPNGKMGQDKWDWLKIGGAWANRVNFGSIS